MILPVGNPLALAISNVSQAPKKSKKGSGLEKSDLSVAPFSNNLADGRIKMADLFFPVIFCSSIHEHLFNHILNLFYLTSGYAA